jgi:hypothetical protein
METLVEKITELSTNEIVSLVNDIAKKSKKKRLSSGNMFFRDFCKTIANALQKESTKELLHKYNLV